MHVAAHFRFSPVLAMPVLIGYLCASPPLVESQARAHYLAEVWDTDRGLPDYAVTGVVQTQGGYLWVGTIEGLTRFDGHRFHLVTRDTTAGYPGVSTSPYVDRRGRLWAATDAGVACREDGRWRAYAQAGGRPVEGGWSFAEDRDGRIYITTYSRLYRTAGRVLEEVPIPPSAPGLRVHRDAKGDIWISCPLYCAKWTGSGWRPIRLPAELLQGRVMGVDPRRDGGLWLAGEEAVYSYKDGAWTVPFRLPSGLRFTGVVRLAEDHDGNLWVGDYSLSLVQFRKNGHMLHFGPADGFPGHAVFSLFEDRERNVWVSTNGGGLVRLRPRAARMFDASNGLNYAVVDSLAEQAPDRMLVGTYGGGLQGFTPSTGVFGPALRGLGSKTDRHAEVLAVLRGRTGDVWATVSQHGLFRIRGDQVQQVSSAEFDNILWSLFEDRSGVLWLGMETGIASYDGKAVTFHRAESGIPKDWITAVGEDSRGAIWAGGRAGLFRREGTQFRRFLPPGLQSYAPVTALYKDRQGWLWIAVTGRGLDRWRDGVLESYGHAQGLPDSPIGGILEDDLNRLWISTATQGLACITRTSLDAVAAHKQARLDLMLVKKEDGLATNQIRMRYQPTGLKDREGRLWYATLKGLAMVDPKQVQPNRWIPPVRIQEVETGGRTRLLAPGEASGLTLSAGDRRLSLSFAALSYSAPERIRYQYKLEGLDSEWRDTTERTVSFGALPPGKYIFRVRATNNDGVWNTEGAALRINAEAFFWETTWFQVLAGVLSALAAGGAVFLLLNRRLRLRSAQLAREQALRRELAISEKRFSTAFNSSPLAMAISTLDGVFLNVNESLLQQAGYSREEVVGRTRDEIRLWADPGQREEFLGKLRREGRTRGVEARFRTRDGQERHHLVSAEMIELDGQPCILTVSADVTERKLLEERLARAQNLESVGRLAGGVAHDFNNLLTVINGYSEMLLQGHGSHDRSMIEMIRKAGERAAQLTQQLLAFSRKEVIAPRDLNLNELVGEAQRMLSRVLPENIEILTHLEEGLKHVKVDPGQMHRVLVNLAVNARDAMPEGGRLTLETANVVFDEQHNAHYPEVAPGDYVLLAVTDTGHGMDEAVRQRVFEPFFTTKEQGKGTGLGLASVYGIVRQSGGSIRVFSEPGKGTTFTMYFPCARAGAATAEPDRQPDLGGGGETILLVEDQADVRGLARRVLEAAGYRVLPAAHGAEALDLAAAFADTIHLLLTDVVMPGMSGKELAERLAAQRPAMKVLYTSGYTEDMIAHQGILDPGISFLPKPLTPASLLAKVRATLGLTTDYP